MKITQLLEGSKPQKIPASKPRNFVVKNQQTSGAGSHKDKKKAAKQGDVKHKNKDMEMSEDHLNEYGDTAKGQKMLTKVQKRAVDRVTSKRADTDPKYAKKNSDTANRAWDRMTDKDLEETFDDVKDTVAKVGDKVSDTLSNILPKDMRPFDNETAAKNAATNSAAFKPVVKTASVTQKPIKESKVYEQYVGNGSSKNMQMAVDQAKMHAKIQAMRAIHGNNFHDKEMVAHEFGKLDIQSDGKGGYKVNAPITVLQPKSNSIDSSPATNNISNPPNSYMDSSPAKDNGTTTSKMSPMESMADSIVKEMNRNPDLMSQSDYDRYQQSQMDNQKRNFKRDELEHELSHEDRGMYWVVVAKNGKWEHTKAQPKQEGMNAAMRLISALHSKYPGMHLGMQYPNGQVENFGKGRK